MGKGEKPDTERKKKFENLYGKNRSRKYEVGNERTLLQIPSFGGDLGEALNLNNGRR